MSDETYTIDGSRIRGFDDFINEFHRALGPVIGIAWNGNLDVFNDILDWPVLDRPGSKYTLHWAHSDASRSGLGHAEMARWLERKVGECQPCHVSPFRQELEQASAGLGPTMFETIASVIRDHPNIELKLA